MNSKYLPSKKFLKIALVVLVIIVIIYFIFLYSKTYKSLKNPTITTSTVQIQELLEKDTDNDGVRDWEEALWGTDTNKANTFGMPDKTYIANKKKEVASKSGESGTATDENLDDTEKIAREFLSTILTLKESGNLNSFNISNLAQKFSADIGADADLADVYTKSDVKLGADTAAAKKAYYTTFSKSIATAKKGGMGAELNAIARFFTEAEAKPEELTKIAGAYTTLTNSLKAMQVPPSAATLHLALLNQSANMATSFKNIVEISNNSIIGLIAISQFKANEPKLEKTISDYITYFKSNGIIK
jgi:hypothetical protein